MSTAEMIGKRLSELREKKGVNQQEAAENVLIKRATLANYETGKRSPDYETLVRLADYYGVSCDYIIRGVKSEQVDIYLATGLWNKTIANLKHIITEPVNDPNSGSSVARPEAAHYAGVIFESAREVMNLFLGSEAFPDLIALLAELIEYDWGSNPEYDDLHPVDKLDKAEKELDRSLRIYYRNRIIQQVFENICEEIYKAKTGNSLREKCKDGAALILSRYTSMDNDPGFWALLEEESDGNNPKT